ncbi:MAG: hypothetical protein HRT87_09680 [Legionellales bacterium]|nr:hypothetical protein [Legionellales bacterium]
MKKILIIVISLCSTFIYAQVGIGTTTPNSDAALDINGASGGLLFPRVALTDTTSPAPLGADVEGMTVYNTATISDVTPGLYYNNGSVWIKLGSSSSGGWDLNGNSGTINGTNFIGTTDNQAVDFRTNNNIRARLTTKGQLELINSTKSTFIGELSGTNASTAWNAYNVGVGYKTLNNGNGRYNTAMGYSAMKSPQNSSWNVAVGYLTMSGNLNGANWNTAFGYKSLEGLTSGDGNTAIGHLSQISIATGSQNTTLGYHTLHDNVGGEFNIAIGARAMSYGLSGDYNIAIGVRCGANSSGSNNVFIGTEAGLDENNSNKLYIENSSSDKALIVGDFNVDRVGINYKEVDLTHTLNVGGNVKIDTFLNLKPSATPISPSEGDVYFDSTSKKMRVYNGTVWDNLN